MYSDSDSPSRSGLSTPMKLQDDLLTNGVSLDSYNDMITKEKLNEILDDVVYIFNEIRDDLEFGIYKSRSWPLSDLETDLQYSVQKNLIICLRNDEIIERLPQIAKDLETEMQSLKTRPVLNRKYELTLMNLINHIAPCTKTIEYYVKIIDSRIFASKTLIPALNR